MNIDALLAAAKFDAAGLLPVIAQDRTTGVVRMLAWANAEALRATAATGDGTFFSRSRDGLWRKGETSGNTLKVHDIRIDCDGDTVLYLVDAVGPSCHTGHTSCFHRSVGGDDVLITDDAPPDPPAVILSRLQQVIASRQKESPDKSYVARLLAAGFGKIGEKIQEEAGEVVQALPEGDAQHTAHEAADVIFHVMVGLQAAGVPVDEVFAELRRRFGTSGLVEKANRHAD